MPIFDQGYQHWSGSLSGHGWRWLAITRRGFRNALQVKFVRHIIFAAWVPALALAFLLCLWGLLERQSTVIDSIRPMLESVLGQPIVAGPREYRTEIWTICFSYFMWIELGFSMVLILLVGPNLISQDLRYNALPLYFSRPLRRIDYLLGKLGTIGALIAAIVVVPALVAYALGLLFSLDITIIRDTFRIFLASIGYGLVITISAGMLILAMSSLSRNSRYIALLWFGIWLVTNVVALILTQVEREATAHRGGRGRFSWRSEAVINRQLEAAKTDWRPLVSYTANLTRVGEQMLGTRAAWERLAQIPPPGHRWQLMRRLFDTQYPWYWSAFVLAALLGLSACILNLAIKPLDRLR